MEDPSSKKSHNLFLFFPQLLGWQKNSLNFWFFWGGIFVTLIFVIGIIYGRYFSQDRLITLAPVDTVLYAEGRNPIWPWQRDRISQLPFDYFFEQAKTRFNGLNIKDDILPGVSQAAFLLLPNPENQSLNWVFIFKLKNHSISSYNRDKSRLVEEFLSRQPYYSKLNSSLAVIGDSAASLAAIQDVYQKKTFSLKTQVNQDKWSDGIFRLFLKIDNLNPSLIDAGLYSYLQKNSENNFYFNLDRVSSRWRFNIGSDSYSYPSRNNKVSLSYLPNDYVFFVSGINLSQLFDNLGKFKSNLKDFLSETENNFKLIYRDEQPVDPFSLFNQQASLLVFRPSPNSTSTNYALIFSYVGQGQIDLLEKLTKLYLAQRNPDKINHRLPDQTTVTELVANPDKYSFQEVIEGNNQLVRYIKDSGLGFNLAYATSADRLIITDNQDIIASLITDKVGQKIKDYQTQCGRGFNGSYFLINLDNFNQYCSVCRYIPPGVALGKVSRGSVNGCLIKD